MAKRYLDAILSRRAGGWNLDSADGERFLDKCENMSNIQVLDFLRATENWELVTVYDNDIFFLRKEY